MTETPKNQAELRLLAEMEKLNEKMAALQAEKAALERILIKLRRENAAQREITRINSIDRLLVEKQVLDFLKQKDGPAATAKLYTYVRITIPELKENTFRSQLHRMKNRGVIVSVKDKRGVWKLPGKE